MFYFVLMIQGMVCVNDKTGFLVFIWDFTKGGESLLDNGHAQVFYTIVFDMVLWYLLINYYTIILQTIYFI